MFTTLSHSEILISYQCVTAKMLISLMTNSEMLISRDRTFKRKDVADFKNREILISREHFDFTSKTLKCRFQEDT